GRGVSSTSAGGASTSEAAPPWTRCAATRPSRVRDKPSHVVPGQVARGDRDGGRSREARSRGAPEAARTDAGALRSRAKDGGAGRGGNRGGAVARGGRAADQAAPGGARLAHGRRVDRAAGRCRAFLEPRRRRDVDVGAEAGE